MPTKLDVFLIIALSKKTIKEIREELPSATYLSIYNNLNKLQEESLVINDNNHYSINKQKSQELFSLVYFCFKNGLDYNVIVSKNIAKYLSSGYSKKYLDITLFNSKTIKKYNDYLSKAGMVFIESKRPLKARIIPSNFTDLLIKFFLNINTKTKLDYDDLDIDTKIEKEYSRYKKKQKISLPDHINFVYTSLSLEGITLTLPQTEKLLRENITPNVPLYKDIQQTENYKTALNFLLTKDINLENILAFHKIAMASLDYGVGKIREQNVIIKGNPNFKTTDWKELSLSLDKFNKTLLEVMSKKEKPSKIIEQAAYLHNEFQRIHPFIDGNSRTSRAIFSVILVKFGFPLVNIPAGYFDVYMRQTKLSERRNDFEFTKLMKLIVLKNLEDRNKI
jgi:fido (protein-threonine AMPylation protein)